MMLAIIRDIADILGMIGVVLLLAAYFLLLLNRLSSDGLIYAFTNFLGSGLILLSLFYNWNLPAALIEGAWMLISAFGIMKCFFRKNFAIKKSKKVA